MALFVRRDPGPCPVCDAPHTICTAPGPTALVIPQLPARDSAADLLPPLVGAVVDPPLLRSEGIQATLPPESVTTATYRKKGHAR